MNSAEREIFDGAVWYEVRTYPTQGGLRGRAITRGDYDTREQAEAAKRELESIETESAHVIARVYGQEGE